MALKAFEELMQGKGMYACVRSCFSRFDVGEHNCNRTPRKHFK